MNERRTAAKQDRQRYEGIWRLCQAFVAGRQWTALSKARDARVIEEPNPRKRQRHTTNVLTQHFWTAIGKLYDDNFRPPMHFARPDAEALHFVDQAARAFQYAWDEEIGANDRILELLVELCGYGTVAARVRLDTMAGAYLGEAPVNEMGKIIPVDEKDEDYQRILTGELRPSYKTMREGRIAWDILSPFNFLVPPGVPYPDKFPWVIVETPMSLDDARAIWPDSAANLAEQDLAQVNLIGDRDVTTGEDPLGGNGKLKEHCLVSTMYEVPSREFPDGRCVHTSQEAMLEEKTKLPYTIAGQPKAGIAFFRYHRVPRRFYGIGIIEPAVGPQRRRNLADSQNSEMKDKNLGRVYAPKGALNESNMPTGKIMELIEVKQSTDVGQIKETQGVPPGPWITAEKEAMDADIERVMGFRDVVNSESMRGVTAYAAFALQAEQEDKRVGPILTGLRSGIIELSKFTVAGIRMWWPTDKQVMVAGPDDAVDAFSFNGSQMPEAVYFRYPTGASAPRSPAAEIQKVFDVYDRSVSSGQPLGVKWLLDSLNAGKCMPFPKQEQDLQREKAELENILVAQADPEMMAQGAAPIMVGPLDDHLVHLGEHRLAIQQAMLMGRQDVAQALMMHAVEHETKMQSQQQLVTSVPGMQGGFGAQGGPQQMPIQQQAMMPPSG